MNNTDYPKIMYDDELTGRQKQPIDPNQQPKLGDDTAVANNDETTISSPDGATNKADDGGYKSYDFVNNLIRQNEEQPDSRRLRERKEATEGVLYGIGDMARALSNLNYTTKYAPSAYQQRDDISAKHKDRIEMARKQRDADRNYYLNYAVNMGQLSAADASAAENKRRWQEQIQLKRDENSAAAAAAAAARAENAKRREQDIDYRNKKLAQDKELAERKMKNDRNVAYIRHSNDGVDGATKSVPLGNGTRVNMSGGDYNSSNAAALNNMLPSNKRATGRKVSNGFGGYENQPPTPDDKWSAVQDYLNDPSVPNADKKAIRDRLRSYGSLVGTEDIPSTSSRRANPMVSSSKKKNPME